MSITIEHAENLTVHFGGNASPAFAQLLGNLLARPRTDSGAPPPEPAPPESALTPPALGQIWPGQGGIYVGTVPSMLDIPAHHLIAGTQETTLKWGPYEDDAPGTSHTNGPTNTHALAAGGDKYPAARWCADYTADGHNDFHLPSRFDLLIAFLSTGATVFDKEGYYWSSTQFSRLYAFVQAFASGDSGCCVKVNEFRVRPFRWIHFNA